IPILHYRLARPRVVIDINGLLLGDIVVENGRLGVGALVRYHQLEESDVIARRCPVLGEAARPRGNGRLRALGRVGGGLGHGRVDDARVAFGGVADRPVWARAVEDALRGREPTADVLAHAAQTARDALEPPSDAFVSGAYRRHVAGVLCRRALARAVARALGQ